MQNAAGGPSPPSDDRNDTHHAVVAELASLLECVQAGIKLIETAIAGEVSLGSSESAANVVVLDDVTPRYLKASAALDTCNAGLQLALHVLRDARTPRHGMEEATDWSRRPVRLIAGV
jgi:hypothetical protein